MRIELTPQEAESYFYNALCNGLNYVEGGYGLQLQYDAEHYKDAKKTLQEKTPNEQVCYEDVLMEILRQGNELSLADCEGEGIYASIYLKDVRERVEKTPMRHLMNMINENDDAETADVIIQQVFLNEIVYG